MDFLFLHYFFKRSRTQICFTRYLSFFLRRSSTRFFFAMAASDDLMTPFFISSKSGTSVSTTFLSVYKRIHRTGLEIMFFPVRHQYRSRFSRFHVPISRQFTRLTGLPARSHRKLTAAQRSTVHRARHRGNRSQAPPASFAPVD